MQGLQIHGSIYVFFQKFVETAYDRDTWDTLTAAAGAKQDYDPSRNYPASELLDMIKEASRLTGLSEPLLKERFGEFLAPDLMAAHAELIDPDWKTYEMILHTEGVMHRAVRQEEINATPPVLNVTQSGNSLIIDYYSRRKMASLAIGIIKGIARHYNEEDSVVVKQRTETEDERVQIKVEFNDREASVK